MKKITTFLLICALMLACVLSLSSCTDGEEDETKHNIIIEDGDLDDLPPITDDGSNENDSELEAAPIG